MKSGSDGGHSTAQVVGAQRETFTPGGKAEEFEGPVSVPQASLLPSRQAIEVDGDPPPLPATGLRLQLSPVRYLLVQNQGRGTESVPAPSIALYEAGGLEPRQTHAHRIAADAHDLSPAQERANAEAIRSAGRQQVEHKAFGSRVDISFITMRLKICQFV